MAEGGPTVAISGPNWQVGDYSVHFGEELGGGTFGTVYKANNKYGNLVAAKRINTRRHYRIAKNEAKLFYKNLVGHKNIITIFDINDEKDMWIFMEYCEYGDLNTEEARNVSTGHLQSSRSARQ